MITYSEKYKASKDTFQFARCRLADAMEELKQALHDETLGKIGFKRTKKPKCYYRKWCINEWFFKDVK